MIFQDALAIAMDAHQGQVDKAGQPYILHPLRVALQFGPDDPAAVVALLHDVIEDTDLEIDDPVFDQLTDEQRVALDLVTKRDGAVYLDYIRAIAANDLAARVKLADLADNMNLDRLEKVTGNDLVRQQRYRFAADLLTAALKGG